MIDGIDNLRKGIVNNEGKLFGAGAAFTSAKEAAANLFGGKPLEGEFTVKEWRSKLQQVLNKGIGLTLRENQSANSISDRDVNFYIAAYFDGLGAELGSQAVNFDTIFKNADPLFERLGEFRRSIELKRQGSLDALSGIENQMVGRTLPQLTGYSDLGLPVYTPASSLLDPVRGGQRYKEEILPFRGEDVERIDATDFEEVRGDDGKIYYRPIRKQ